MNISDDEIKDACSIFGLSNQWYYDNIVAKVIHQKMTNSIDYILYDNGDGCYDLRTRDYRDGYIKIKELDKKRTLLVEYKFDDNRFTSWEDTKTQIIVSHKLANSFMRYLDDKSNKIDKNRLINYFYRHSYYGLLFDKCFKSIRKYTSKK